MARDFWKQARSHAASDKASLVVISACRCMKTLIQSTHYFKNSSDFDNLRSTIFKAIDFPSVQVRHATADCLAEALVSGYSESVTGEAPSQLIKRAKSILPISNIRDKIYHI